MTIKLNKCQSKLCYRSAGRVGLCGKTATDIIFLHAILHASVF